MERKMSVRGVDFLENWIQQNVTEKVKQSVEGDAASLAIELAERAILAAGQAGFALDDLEPEFGTPETIIREALESSEVTSDD
jgi:hypothetical protein